MLGFFDISPYVLYGNWGYEHQKSCKNASKADEDAPDANTGKCTDCTNNCDATTLKLKDNLNPDAAGGPVILNSNADVSNKFESKPAITITTKSKDVDFTTLKEVEITGIKGTIKNASGGVVLQTGSSPEQHDVLNLNASGTISGGTVKLAGTIVVTSSGQQIGDQLNFGGGPSSGGVSGTLSLDNGGTITGSLTIKQAALTSLRTATGTLCIGKDSPTDTSVKYSLVTKDTIIIGLSTLSTITANATNAKVILTGLPTSSINIAPQSTGTGISAESIFGTVVSISQTDNNFTSLKNGDGLSLNLAQTISDATITKAAGGTLTIDETLNKGTMLNISGTSGGTTIKITNINVTKGGKLKGSTSTTYELTGGITGTLNNLSDGTGGKHVQGNLNISKISYDQYEIHDKHKSTLCCYYGRVNLWKEYKYDSNWDGKSDTTVHDYI